MIELHKTTKVHTMWFVSWKENNQFEPGDLLGCLLQQEGEPWELLYRFRYYECEDDGTHKDGGDPFIQADRKSWYRTVLAKGSTPGEVAQRFEKIVQLTMQTHVTTAFDKLEVHGNGMDCIRMMERLPWAHKKAEEQLAEPN